MRSLSRLITVVVTGACILGFFSGCAKAPDEELASTREAVKAAQDAEADKYMANSFKNLQKSLETAETEIKLQNMKFVLNRNYVKAKQLLQNTKDFAAQLTAEAPGAKAELKAQIEEGLTSAKEMIKDSRVGIRKARRSLGKEVLAQMAADLDAAESVIAQASADFAAGNILAARDSYTEGQKLLKKIYTQLTADY